jgi:CRISPR-associated protein Csb1
LIAKEPLVFEFLSRDGSEPQEFTLDATGAAKLLEDAEKEARKHSLGWESEPVTLKPKPELCELIRKSREIKKAGSDSVEDEET